MKKLLTTILVFLGLLTIGTSIGVNAASGDKYSLVTDVNTLSVGDVVIIADATKSAALSTTQNTNNRAGVAITTNSDGDAVWATGVEEITLDSGTAEGTFTFKVQYNDADGWLYAACGTGDNPSNRLKTKESKDAVCDFDITIDSASGVATVKAHDTNLKKNWLRYNGNNGSIFNCHASGQTDIVIMKKKVVQTSGYFINFDANGGTFKADKGQQIEVTTAGQATDVVLPTAADLTTPCAGFTTLKGWTTNDTDLKEPGATVNVSEGTTFKAIYEVPTDPITIENALAIAEANGRISGGFQFSVIASVNKIDTAYNSQYNNITVHLSQNNFSIKAYRMAGGADLAVGDLIKVTGEIIDYGTEDGKQFTQGCTYELITPAIINLVSEVKTKSSLKITYDAELNPTNVDLRLGGIISEACYSAQATYGVLVVEGTATLTAGATSYATVDEFLAVNAGFKNVACTPAKKDKDSNDYQFAWVITDMEGHYDTTLTAVMYMVYDGVLYLYSSKTTSVKATATEYINDASLGLTEDQKAVLTKLTA